MHRNMNKNVIEIHNNTHKNVRECFSLDNLKLDDDVLNIPLFMADQTDKLIGVALEQLRSCK